MHQFPVSAQRWFAALGWAVLIGAFCNFLLWLIPGNYADLDLFGKMAIGAIRAEMGSIPRSDPFSFTAWGEPWIDHEWGSGVLFFTLFERWGSPALFALKSAVLAAILMLIGVAFTRYLPECWHPRERSGAGAAPDDPRTSGAAPADTPLRLSPCSAAVLLAFFLGVATLHLPFLSGFLRTVRCQIFSFFSYALTVWVLEEARRRESWKWLLVLPPTFLCWVNLHGGFAYGWAAIGYYMVWAFFENSRTYLRALAIVLLACVSTVFINPYGWIFVQEIVAAWILPRPYISEWNSMASGYAPEARYLHFALLGCWLLVGSAMWIRTRRFPWRLPMILATAMQGFLHVKLMPFYAITAALLGYRLVNDALVAWSDCSLPGARHRTYPARSWAVVAVTVAVLVFGGVARVGFLLARDISQPGHSWRTLVIGPHFDGPKERDDFPADAVRFLQATGVKGNVWCKFAAGQFIAWCLYPNIRISSDGRFEAVYPARVTDAGFRSFRDAGGLALVEHSAANMLLTPKHHEEFVAAVRESRRWTPVFEDDHTILFARGWNPKLPLQKIVSSKSIELDYFRGDLKRFGAAPLPPWRERSH